MKQMTLQERKHLDGKFKNLHVKVGDLDTKIKRILQILESDDRTNVMGVVETVDGIKIEVQKMKLKDEYKKGQMTVYGGIGAFIAMIIGYIIKQIIEKPL